MEQVDGGYQLTEEELKDKIDASVEEELGFDTPIYRVFDAARFWGIVDTGVVGFVHPTLWDDPFESPLSRARVRHDDRDVVFHNLVEHVYCQCWSFTEESDAMWRIYSPNRTGFKVKTTPRKLVDAFFDTVGPQEHFTQEGFDNFIRIGKVSYCDAQEIYEATESLVGNRMKLLTFKHVGTLLLMKRKPFIHEQEVRVMIRSTKGNGRVLELEMPPQDWIDEVVFDPRMHPENIKVFSAGLRSRGFSCPIGVSSLYSGIEFIIPPERFNDRFAPDEL